MPAKCHGELREKAGLAAGLRDDKAQAAFVWGWEAIAAEAQPSSVPAKDILPFRGTPREGSPSSSSSLSSPRGRRVSWLRRPEPRAPRNSPLALDHAPGFGRLRPICADPDLEDKPAEPDLSTCENVSQLLA
jgi:hypothetical protein